MRLFQNNNKPQQQQHKGDSGRVIQLANTKIRMRQTELSIFVESSASMVLIKNNIATDDALGWACRPSNKAGSHLPQFCFPIFNNKDTSRPASRAYTRPRDGGDGGGRGEYLDKGFSDSVCLLFEWPWSGDFEAEYRKHMGNKQETKIRCMTGSHLTQDS